MGEGATCRHGRCSAPSRPRRRGFLHGPLRRGRPRSQPPEHHRSLARPAASPCRTPTAAYGSLSTARSTTTANCARSFRITRTGAAPIRRSCWPPTSDGASNASRASRACSRFCIWDRRERKLFAARDRFGVKPLNYHLHPDGRLVVASEIRALHAAGVPARPDAASWAAYLTHGLLDHSERTFWEDIRTVPRGPLPHMAGRLRGHPALVRRCRSGRRRVRRPP